MSAPPIAATRWTPSSIETIARKTNGTRLWLEVNHRPRTTTSASAPRLSQLRNGRVNGFDANRPFSLPQATIEPVKVTAPMKTPIHTSVRWKVLACRSSRNELNPTSTAASPTKLCSRAISSGIPVISTVRARQMPIAAPIASAA